MANGRDISTLAAMRCLAANIEDRAKRQQIMKALDTEPGEEDRSEDGVVRCAVYSREEAAARLGCTTRTISNMQKNGRLVGVQGAKGTRNQGISRESVEAVLRGRRATA